LINNRHRECELGKAAPGGENGRSVFCAAARTPPCGCPPSAIPDASMSHQIASTPDNLIGGAP